MLLTCARCHIGNHQLLGNLFVALTLRDQAQHLQLPHGEWVGRQRLLGWMRQHAQHLAIEGSSVGSPR